MASARLRRLHTAHRERAKLESILDAWKETVGAVDSIGQLKQLFVFRDWLAHGRYWRHNAGLDPEPQLIVDRVTKVTRLFARYRFPLRVEDA